MDKTVKLYFGGTFDPFHNGHLTIAKHTASFLGIDEVILLPAHIPPHKASPQVNSEHRLAMLNALATKNTLFSVDGRELKRETPSYTVTTLQEIKTEQPHSALNFIIGMDSLLSLKNWYQWQEVLTLTNFIVCTRPGYKLGKELGTSLAGQQVQIVDELADYLIDESEFEPTRVGQILLAPMVEYDISSTSIKLQLAKAGVDNSSTKHLPSSILDYIVQHKLYI